MHKVSLSLDPSRLDIDAIHAFLTTTYWSAGISRDVVARAIAGSVCIGAFQGDAQVGFARLVTDKATFAYLADVYVLVEHRGQGLARAMLDAYELYAKYGFTPLGAPDRFMELHRPDVYRAPVA